MQGKIKLILVDDILMIRYGISQMLRYSSNIEIIAEAENGKQFLDLLAIYKPNVVLMDIKMPIMDGLEATKRALNINPFLKIIALTGDANESTLDQMVLSGAKGFLLKSVGISELEKAIDTVMNGGSYISTELMGMYKR